MTNEMELIKALCKVLGFQIERVIDRKERKETQQNAMFYNRGILSPRDGRALKSGGALGELDIDENGMYTSYLVSPIISYKLTKIEVENNNDQ